MSEVKNPLSGVGLDSKGKNIVDADGNSLLERQGLNWSENDQMGFDLLMQSMQNDFQLNLMQYQNEYNSPDEMAMRMREAGLNPDLLGLDGVSPASSAADSVSTPRTSLQAGQEASRISSNVFDAFSMAERFVNSYTNFKSAQIGIDSLSIGNAQMMDDLALEYVIDTISPRSFSEDGKLQDDVRYDLISSARSFGRKRGLSRQQSKSFEDSVSRKIDSPSFLSGFYGYMNDYSLNRKSYNVNSTGKLYSDSDKTMKILLDEVVDMMIERDKSSYRSQKAQYDSSSEYYTNFDSALDASSDNESNVLERQLNQNQYRLGSRRHNIIDKLYKSYKGGNMFSGIVLSFYRDAIEADLKPLNFGPKSFEKGLKFIQ